MALRLDVTEPGFPEAFAALIDQKREASLDVSAAVAEILREVGARGDGALIDYTRRFDGVELAPEELRIGEDKIEAALRDCPQAALEALAFAKARIEAFHRRQVPQDDH